MKKVLITGTGRGIGWATTLKFLQEGYFVIGTSTSGESPLKHENFECYQLQLMSEISISSAVDQIFSKHPQIDLFINNAGFADDEPAGLDITLLRKTIEINVIGTAAFAEKVYPNIADNGRVIFLGSMMGNISHLDSGDYPAYRISKAGLHMYARLTAKNLSDRNITVATLHPGWVKTDMGGEDAPKTAQKAADELFELATKPNLPTDSFWNETTQIEW